MVDSLFSLSKMECCATPPIEICEIFCHLRSKGGDFPWRIWGRREKLVRWNISYNILESEKVNWDMYTWGIPDSIWRVICSCMETSVSLASCWIDSGILSGQGLKSLGWVNWEFTSLKLSKPPYYGLEHHGHQCPLTIVLSNLPGSNQESGDAEGLDVTAREVHWWLERPNPPVSM